MVEHWKKNKVYRIHASVDAVGDLYEEIRVGAEWDKTYENIRLIGQSGIPFCINVVLTKKTIDGMLDMIKMTHQIGAKEITFLMPICAYGDDREIRPEDNETNRQMFSNAAELCRRLGIKWIFPLELNPTFRRFNFPFIRPQISMEGDMFACCYSLGRGKVWFEGYGYKVPDYNMGNMFKKGFHEVWHGEGFKKIRSIYKESEVPKGTVISRQELLERTKAIMEQEDPDFEHCKICLAILGMACS